MALAAGLSVLLYLASMIVASGAAEGTEAGVQATQLIAINKDPTNAVVIPAILQAIAIFLMAVPLLYIFAAARKRTPAVRRELIGFYFLGPVLIAAQFILFAVAVSDTAETFANENPELARVAEQDGVDALDVEEDSAVEDEAEDAGDDNSTVATAQIVRLVGFLCFGIALFYAGIWGMRTGLLTRFNGSFAMALGVVWALSFFFGNLGYLVTVLWMIFVAFFFARGVHTRPPAWAEGRAIPWPKPGTPVEQPGGTVEGSGREVLEKPLPEDSGGAAAGSTGAEEPQASEDETQGRRRKKRKRRS